MDCAAVPVSSGKSSHVRRRQTRRHAVPWSGIAGLALMGIPVLLLLFTPWIITADPHTLHPDSTLQGPSWIHPFGTDLLGRDQLARVLYGGRISLRVAAIVLVLTVGIGSVIGSVAGYFGGFADESISFVLNIVLALPELSLTLALVAVLGPGEQSLLIALTATDWAGYARLFRGAVMTARSQLFVQAARAYGASHGRILFRHIIPNVARPILALASLQFAGIMLALAGLSFLGLGVQPPLADWGTLLSDARPYLRTYPHLTVAPAGFIVAVSVGANLMADALLVDAPPRRCTV